MESASKNTSNTEDLLSVILTHIKQNNGNVKDLLEGPHLKNNEDLEKCISSLILLIHDLSRTFCDELSRATESLQSTFHLLKGIQNKFKDFDSNNEEIQYIASINQVLGDTAKNLKVAEEKLNIISEQYKSDKEKKSNVSNHINEEDVIDGKMITPSARSDNAREKIEKVEQSDKSNKQHDEVNTLTIMNGSAIAKANHASSEDIFHQEVNSKKSTGYSSENKKHEETNAERHMDAKQPSNNIHQTEYSSTAKPAKETNKELHLNGKIPNLSKEDMLESKVWDKETYKEYILETDNEQRSSCFIKAPAYVLEQLQCRLMDDISSLLVSESEELVSNVLGLWSKDPDLKIPFPLSISIPFNSRYRGNYKDVMVKANDEKLHASYLTPNSLDGYHGTHKGSFAEIKVYKLGIYAVVSCLRKENFTIPKKGLSVKLSMDSRISLNYPPGCFNTSVIVQFKVQPIDTSLISLLKVKQDIYHSVVSSSPLVHVKQPSIHRFHKNITVILPCPPNPEKKKQAEDTENKRASTATASRIAQAHQIRAVSASVRKPGDNPTELLKLIAFKEDQWIILDDVVVKNIQNGIVLFEVAEHLQSFTVIRLSSPMDNSHLLSFIQNLQDAIHSSMVNVVLYRRKDNPQKAVVQLIPSKELNWEVLNLRDAGYTGPPEPSEQIPLQEGEQIHLRFCGNISHQVCWKSYEIKLFPSRSIYLVFNYYQVYSLKGETQENCQEKRTI
uniref:Death domain containing 1 n=1 Tax=Leptobrachium leishanense TaxID=445787 RepID=A0A8C5LUH5_9ANUR